MQEKLLRVKDYGNHLKKIAVSGIAVGDDGRDISRLDLDTPLQNEGYGD